MYIPKVYSIHYTLRKKQNVKKISFGQKKLHKKCTVFFLAFNSAEAQGPVVSTKSIPCNIKMIEKQHKFLLPHLWFLSCNKKFQNSAWVGAPQKVT